MLKAAALPIVIFALLVQRHLVRGLTLGESRGCHIERSFFGVEVLFGDQFFVIEGLRADEVESLLLEIGLTLENIRLGGFFRGEEAGDIGGGGGDAPAVRLLLRHQLRARATPGTPAIRNRGVGRHRPVGRRSI